MATQHRPDASFDVITDPGVEDSLPDVLLAGFSSYGLAGLTAVDYLADQLALEPVGHVRTDALPPITPFEAGRPRHHTRLFADPDGTGEIGMLINELFVPIQLAVRFTDTVIEWARTAGVAEIGVLSGVPVPHGPDDHRVFHVATEGYAETRLEGRDLPGMGSGFLDGINAGLIGRAIDSPLRAGVLVIPVHAQAPDVEAALRLVEAASDVYDLEVDSAPLQAFASEVERYYSELAQRVEQADPEQLSEDRMFM